MSSDQVSSHVQTLHVTWHNGVIIGETISSAEYSQRPGGKARSSTAHGILSKPVHMVATTLIAPNLPGANQAVSVAASGSAVEFAGSVGSDGAWLKVSGVDSRLILDPEFLKERGVGTDLMLVHPGKPSGRAIIQTTPEGEVSLANTSIRLNFRGYMLAMTSVVSSAVDQPNPSIIANAIFLFPGTNHASYPADSPALQPYHTHLLLQNEILLSDTVETLSAAYQQGIVSIFNPSPMLSPEELRLFPWEKLSILVVNQGEARSLLDALGKQNQKLADSEGKVILDALYALPTLSGLSGIVVTLGGSGAVASFSTPSRRETIQLPALKTPFLRSQGSLMRVSGKTWDISQLKEALKRSIVAASLSTERPGAMSSIPSNLEVETQLATYHS
ncbi:PfkB domain-containing protein [Rhizoctonia solani AG-1 IA]|uniref:PfkB domain-containing protein n=1 Tax=Thanatephorus cucumeris (strain AG1-IA) TaxID=983506 RepID=L8X8P7_THACA|nr:PfkB domain-containing protein [Rhizoctonia solani AG-1 IA]